MRTRWLTMALALASCSASGQRLTSFDDFSAAGVDPARWEPITEAGRGPAVARVENGVMVLTGNGERAGIASRVRLGRRFAVEADACGWTGVNQILQVYGGTGGYDAQFEVGLEGTQADGTPVIHVWAPEGELFNGPCPRPGPVSPERPLRLRLERNGNDYRLFADGRSVKSFTTAAVPGEARIVFYGYGSSVCRWDNVSLSGPPVSLVGPAPGASVRGPVDVRLAVPEGAADAGLFVGRGAHPVRWYPHDPAGRPWAPGPNTLGPVTFRATASDEGGYERSAWTTVNVDRPALWEPLVGQVVGPAFRAAIGGATAGAVSARFYLDGRRVASSTASPFWARLRPVKDGPAVLAAALVDAAGRETRLPPVWIVVKRNLYGGNARVADAGRGIRFPDGTAGPLIGANESYTWTGLEAMLRGDPETGREYIRGLRQRGVNVMRMFLEAASPREVLLEDPLGRYVPRTVAFWDKCLSMCERSGMTLILSPWDTFWMNQPWTANPYNVANGGPCRTQREFITSPEARKWQKARFRYAIDRWGGSTAILAWDLLNEYDIWWGATPEERNAWVDDMATFVRAYELKRWGRAHMLTVSASRAEPGGVLADTVYRHPLFDIATTHLYYWGTVNDPRNIIDPALSMNRGVRYALQQIRDGRPYTDSESGPIDKWVASEAFDNAVHHHESWAHFASGGCGPGMRWPYRGPHILTPGMRHDEEAIALVARGLDWDHFQPANIDARLKLNRAGLIAMGCADAGQALIWITQDTRSAPARRLSGASLTIAGFRPGRYAVTFYNVHTGLAISRRDVSGPLRFPLPPIDLDLALTIRRI